MSFLNLGDNTTQIQLSSGTLLVRVRRLADSETYEIDTPNLAFSVLRPGLYRLTVDPSGNTTAIGVRSGQGEATGGGTAYPVGPNEYDAFSGTDPLTENSQPYGADEDALGAWSADRDSRWDRSASARYVSPDVIGYQDLDDQGSWTATPEFGNVWFPRQVDADWAPYHSGHWAYVAPWGYTWVDDSPWGFAPFHYGRWVRMPQGWGWIPAPPVPPNAVYLRPVYAPALVAWLGVGVGVAWFALGPREVFVPSYPVSRAYVNNVNISNTTVNTTVINNIYNTTVVNKTVITNVTYVNRNVRGAVAATTSQAFASAQPVSRNVLKVDPGATANAKVNTFAPAAVPTKQAVLGSGRVSAVKPPAAVQTRAVIVRTAPPPPPLPFERREEAIKSNGGKPLSMAQVRQIAPNVAPRTAPVKIAPPARLVKPATAATVAPRPSSVPNADHPAPRPALATAPPTKPVATAIHPSELPVPPKPASPGNANSVLERQHLQDQQKLYAQQSAERERLQQQQDLQHQQRSEQARQQQLEQQHQAQTAQLAQKHAQELQRQQAKQEEEKRRQESGPPAKAPTPSHALQTKP
jgi:hypothetical protein